MTDYRRMELKDGELVEVEAVSIPQSQLTADCFMVQFRGLAACEDCAYHNTVNCGGGAESVGAYLGRIPSTSGSILGGR